jgi:hypothetical protein
LQIRSDINLGRVDGVGMNREPDLPGKVNQYTIIQ